MTENKSRQPKNTQTAAKAGTVGGVCYIDRLQNEILWEIFLFYSSTTTVAVFENYGRSQNSRSRFENNGPSRINTNYIARVNKRWNTIALAIPSLWSKIYISIQAFSHGRSLEAFLDHRLKLSKDAPLDICVLFSNNAADHNEYNGGDSDGDSDEDSDKAFPVLAKLFQHAHRWRSAVLQLPDELVDIKFPDTFLILQELEMRCASRIDASPYPCPISRAPLLRKLATYMFSFGGSCGSSHLDEITLTWVIPDAVLGFLEDASPDCNAKVFTMYTPEIDEYAMPATTSRLKSLSFIQREDKEDYSDVHADLFKSLTLPNIEELVFIDERTGRANRFKPSERSKVLFPVMDLLSMLSRSETSFMKLSHLEFGGHYISDQNLLNILTKLLALEFFGFKETCLLDENSRALTAHFLQGVMSADMVPQITQLELIFYDGIVPVDELVSFLESRRPSLEGDESSMRSVPLKQIRIGISSPQTCAALTGRLSGLCSGGLIVEVSKPWF
ncbi:hypothetical protein BDP27DRAFT_1320181 [Rhodocollybia butyracea]|uniref:Uncharacterized protein n=1 Tax=Rhodocollybia butyracea TaxID=206335 RepID=A0A9P5Q1U4_9AGAR|nr:hypothetical protein BDP27DRAFT_1320181 [Rhodocollybia butyracea]